MSQEHVEPCCRFGRPAEQPAIASGHVSGQERDHLPLCVDCLELQLEDARAFWAGMKKP
jgi:hypothetical protein